SVFRDGAYRTLRQIDPATLFDKRPSERGMMAPSEVNCLAAFIRNFLMDVKHGLLAPQRHCLCEMKGCADGSNVEADLYFIRIVSRDGIAPGQEQHLAVLADFGALVHRRVPAVWKQFLPAALVIVHMRAG